MTRSPRSALALLLALGAFAPGIVRGGDDGAPAPKGAEDVTERLRSTLRKDGYEPLAGLGDDGVLEFGLGVAERLSSDDLVLVTDAGTETLAYAFVPLGASPERARGTPLPYAEGAGAVPAPGRLADPSPEGLARFWSQVESGTAPTILLTPSKKARIALAPFLDATNALTAESKVELEAARAVAPHAEAPSVATWIAARRDRASPAAGPLRVPVLVLSDATIERLERPPTIRSIDFEVRFGPEHAAWRAGKGGRSIVLGRVPAALGEEKSPAVVLSASYDARSNAGSSAACVLAAARALAPELGTAGAKIGLVVCLLDGESYGRAASRALAPRLAERFQVVAALHVGDVERLRDGRVRVLGASRAPELATGTEAALKTAGLAVVAEPGTGPGTRGDAHDSFLAVGIPALTLVAAATNASDESAEHPQGLEPDGVDRLAGVLRDLVRSLLR